MYELMALMSKIPEQRLKIKEAISTLGARTRELLRIRIGERPSADELKRLSATVKNHPLLFSLSLDPEPGRDVQQPANLPLDNIHNLLEALIQNKALLSLELSGFRMDKKAVSLLPEVIECHPVLGSLSLGWTTLQDEDLHLLAASLLKRDKLAHLDLSGNPLTDQGAEYLASFLRETRHLESFVLTENRMTSRGVETLVSAMLANQHIALSSFLIKGVVGVRSGVLSQHFTCNRERRLNDRAALEAVTASIRKEIARLEKTPSFFFRGRAREKATQVGAALRRAEARFAVWESFPGIRLENFLSEHVDGQLSLMDVLGQRRYGYLDRLQEKLTGKTIKARSAKAVLESLQQHPRSRLL